MFQFAQHPVVAAHPFSQSLVVWRYPTKCVTLFLKKQTESNHFDVTVCKYYAVHFLLDNTTAMNLYSMHDK